MPAGRAPGAEGNDAEVRAAGRGLLEIDLEGQFEVGLRRQIPIGEQQHFVEGLGAAKRLGEAERLLEVAGHIFHGDGVERFTQLAVVIRERRETARGFAESNEAQLLVGQQPVDALAQTALHFLESRIATGVIERAHARGDIDEHRQPMSAGPLRGEGRVASPPARAAQG